jgi:cytochrome c oxidase cbb3-type subunit 2
VVAHPGPNDKVVTLPPQFAPAGGQVVATQEALDLVAYLTALNHTYPVPATESGVTK